MKRKFLAITSLLVLAGTLTSCGGYSYEKHDGVYETKEKATGMDALEAYGTAQGLLGKKVSFTYTEKVEILVDANGGTSDFSSFRAKTDVTVTGYIDFSATNFYAYTKTDYKQVNDTTGNYVKESLIKAADGGKYTSITTDETKETEYENVYGAFGAVFGEIAKVSKTKATVLDSNAFLYDSTKTIYDWLYAVVGLSSKAANGVDDWADNAKVKYGKTADGGLVAKTVAPLVGYETDQGVSDFGYGKQAAGVQMRVNKDGYIDAWDVDYNGKEAGLDFKIMEPAPTVTVTGSRSFRANYAATAPSSLPTSIEHKQGGDAAPEVKYAFTGESNGFAMDLTLYTDNSFKVTAPTFGGVECAAGTYTGGYPTLTLTATSHAYISPWESDTTTFNVAATFELTTDSFFNGLAATFNLAA